MENPPELGVDSLQEQVRPSRPALVYGGHGGHVTLQVKEVFLHLEKHEEIDFFREKDYNSIQMLRKHSRQSWEDQKKKKKKNLCKFFSL